MGYAITNLDLSGFRLRKEDVEVQLVDLSGGLEVAVKEGGAGGSSNNHNNSNGSAGGGTAGAGAVSNRGRTAGGGGGASAGGGGAEDDEEMAAVPWATSSVDGAAFTPGDGSVVSPPEQRRQAAYTAVLGGAGSARLPEELQVSWDRGGEGNFEDGAGFAEGVVGEGGVGGSASPPVPPPPREEMAPAEVLRVVARGVRAEFKTLQWACRQVGLGMATGTLVA